MNSRSSINRGSSTIRRSSSSSSSRRRNMAYNYTPSSTRYEVSEANGRTVYRIPSRNSAYSTTKTKVYATPSKNTRRTYVSPVNSSGNQRKVVRTSKPTSSRSTYNRSTSRPSYKSTRSSSSYNRSSSSYSRSSSASSSSRSSAVRSSSSSSSSRSSSSSGNRGRKQ